MKAEGAVKCSCRQAVGQIAFWTGPWSQEAWLARACPQLTGVLLVISPPRATGAGSGLTRACGALTCCCT